MEEVDSIILHFLRQLHINIGDEVKNICDLPVETIIESASKCLSTINQSLKVPPKLPSGISHRIEVAAQIASICKDLGYKNDVGYQTFLYYNEAELRHVFMFLIEKLPNESKQTTTNVIQNNKNSLLRQEISNKIAEDLCSIWIPPCCKSSIQKSIGDFHSSPVVSSYSAIEPSINEQEIIKKLLTMREINKSPNPISTRENEMETLETGKDRLEVRKDIKYDLTKSLKELKEMAIVLKQNLDTLESEKNVMDIEYTQAQQYCGKAQADLRNIQNILNSIGITDIESEDGNDNILEKVHTSINILHKKSEEVTSRNILLKMEIDKLKNSIALHEPERSKCKKILVNLKETAKTIKEEYNNKEELKMTLCRKYEKLKGGNKRSIYTKRILEIISNIDKQNMEIKKILEDTRQLQKEINSFEGQLDRCFSIADETLFRDAKKDDQAKKAYKLLALLHSECNTIVSLVNETGILARDIVDLEDNIKAEKAKRTEDTLKKIQLDFTRLQQESEIIRL